MNIVEKIYCRVIQVCFKVVLPVLPYRDPVVLASEEDIVAVLREKKVFSVLIVTDESIYGLGLVEKLKTMMNSAGITYTVYDKTLANPTIANVEEARMLYLENECEAIVGFGGGSPMDCAKAVGARIVKPKQPIPKMKGILKIHKRLPLFIAVPTTAGTGSETTLAAVITDGETRHKFPMNDFPLIPRYAALMPEVTKGLPPFITATTGMDALTHAVEAYIGRSTTKETRRYALEATRLIFGNIEKVYINGTDMEARKNMLYASFLAGKAFSKSYVGYCHAVAHSLGGKYNTSHGLANAVLLPYVLKAYGETVYRKLKELAVAAGLVSEMADEEETAKLFIEKICALNEAMGIPAKLQGICTEDIPELAKLAAKEGNPLYPVPKLMGAKELEQFYYDVIEDKKSG
ncbi:MAG: iron-containing alcohol dehydrogenase [Lachnospiraceae bacterium]|nr:iron-containing alcohol dehydrogenase [Lachnospiraceae bacterium]MBQ8846059.1 iron-containing alcohol dehydrogenase [Lachnospiraceae bacterium]